MRLSFSISRHHQQGQILWWRYLFILIICLPICLTVTIKHQYESFSSDSLSLSHQFPAEQYEGLRRFYDSLSGYQWYWSQPYQSYGYPWNFDSFIGNPCNPVRRWQGVLCNASCLSEPCSIIEIDLPSRLLIGKYTHILLTLF